VADLVILYCNSRQIPRKV